MTSFRPINEFIHIILKFVAENKNIFFILNTKQFGKRCKLNKLKCNVDIIWFKFQVIHISLIQFLPFKVSFESFKMDYFTCRSF